MAVESRKVQLVDIALDLIQKLIAYKHLQGAVHSISHRRDPAGKGARRRLTEDDEDLESNAGDTSLPQVCHGAPVMLCLNKMHERASYSVSIGKAGLPHANVG